MVLNGRKQMTQFIKEKNISGTTGLMHSLLLYVIIRKSLYYTLYTTLHLFPKIFVLMWKSFSVMINYRDIYKMESIHFAVSNSVVSCFSNGLGSWVCSPAFLDTLRAGRGRPSLTSSSHWVTPVIKSQPKQRAACSLLCYLDKMLLIPLSLKLEFYFNKHKIISSQSFKSHWTS